MTTTALLTSFIPSPCRICKTSDYSENRDDFAKSYCTKCNRYTDYKIDVIDQEKQERLIEALDFFQKCKCGCDDKESFFCVKNILDIPLYYVCNQCNEYQIKPEFTADNQEIVKINSFCNSEIEKSETKSSNINTSSVYEIEKCKCGSNNPNDIIFQNKEFMCASCNTFRGSEIPIFIKSSSTNQQPLTDDCKSFAMKCSNCDNSGFSDDSFRVNTEKSVPVSLTCLKCKSNGELPKLADELIPICINEECKKKFLDDDDVNLLLEIIDDKLEIVSIQCRACNQYQMKELFDCFIHLPKYPVTEIKEFSILNANDSICFTINGGNLRYAVVEKCTSDGIVLIENNRNIGVCNYKISFNAEMDNVYCIMKDCGKSLKIAKKLIGSRYDPIFHNELDYSEKTCCDPKQYLNDVFLKLLGYKDILLHKIRMIRRDPHLGRLYNQAESAICCAIKNVPIMDIAPIGVMFVLEAAHCVWKIYNIKEQDPQVFQRKALLKVAENGIVFLCESSSFMLGKVISEFIPNPILKPIAKFLLPAGCLLVGRYIGIFLCQFLKLLENYLSTNQLNAITGGLPLKN